MAISQSITVLPTPPSRADPDNFDARADAFLGALPTMQTQMNTWAGQANTTAAEIGIVSEGLLSVTPAANKVPQADGDGELALGWLDLTGYAPAANGVTGGDSHDHNGGDGAQIAYSSLSGPPTLGTAAAKNIPATGDASVTEVVYGSDTRLTNARTPASHTTGSHSDWPAAVSMTELGYLDGVTSALQTQINARKVLQVVSDAYETPVTNNTTTYAASGLSASITPSSSSSTILIFATLSIWTYVTVGSVCGANTRLKRNSTVISEKTDLPYVTATEIKADVNYIYRDSPASTSTLTYAIDFSSSTDPGTARAQSANSPSSITLIEIAA